MDQTELVSLITDPDTTLLTEAYFRFRIDEEFKKSRRFGWPLSLVLIEVDGLDDVEAAQGGDGLATALLNISGTILTASRDVDLSARLGASRFGMLLPGTGADGAETMVQRVMSTILEASGGALHLSVGVTDGPREGLEKADEFVARAVKAVDVAKGQGADQLVSWTGPSA